MTTPLTDRIGRWFSRARDRVNGRSVPVHMGKIAMARDRATRAAPVDVLVRDDEILVRADVPGVARDRIHVAADERMLTIWSETDPAFFREVPLPRAITGEASAALSDGVLTVELHARPARRIEVRSASN